MEHRCCGWLELRRGAVAIGVFYVCYLLLLTVTLATVAGVTAQDSARAAEKELTESEAELSTQATRLGVAAGVALLLSLAAGGLLLGAARRRRPLLLLWLLMYGATLLTLSVGVFGLAIAAETGQRTFLTQFCRWHRCSYRIFHYTMLLFAVEWYLWAVILMRYRQLGREARADISDTPQQPGVMVRSANGGGLQLVPVTYYGDDGQLKQPNAPTAGAAYNDHMAHAAAGVDPWSPAETGRHAAVARGF